MERTKLADEIKRIIPESQVHRVAVDQFPFR